MSSGSAPSLGPSDQPLDAGAGHGHGHPSLHQALFTTYPSRLRLGTSSLAQPIYTNAYIHHRLLDRAHSPLDGLPNTASAIAPLPAPAASKHALGLLGAELGKRARRVVNYSETESRAVEHDGESALDDDGSNGGRSKLGSRVRPHPNTHSSRFSTQASNSPRLSSIGLPSSSNLAKSAIGRTGTPNSSETDQRSREEVELQSCKYADGKSYLGLEPPAKWIRVQRRPKRSPIVMDSLSLCQNLDLLSDDFSLVPIRVELETEELRIRDVFTWNVQERFITPETFAVEFCTDVGISPAVYAPKITEQIKSQLNELSALSTARLTLHDEQIAQLPDQEVMGIEPDLRVIIQLDVQIETLHLMDRIEWDLASNLTPELFTFQYIRDLNLPRSALPIVAHAIHEEIFRHKRDCIALGLISPEVLLSMEANDGESLKNLSGLPSHYHHHHLKIESDPLLKERYGNNRGPKKLEGVWRDWNEANGFGPKLEELHPEDIEWIELEKERSLKRTRRETVRNSRRR